MTPLLRNPASPSVAFQHDFRVQATDSEASLGRKDDPRRSTYERLATVAIHHGFFSSRSGVCPSFSIHPTAATVKRLRSLGLRLHGESGTLAVLHDLARQEALLAALRRERKPSGAWARLSFVLTVEASSYFVNATDIPLTLSPLNQNFYFTNRDAHRVGQHLLLQPGPSVTAKSLWPIVPTHHIVQVQPGVDRVQVVNVSGDTVDDLETQGNPRVTIDFSRLPLGTYELRQMIDGKPKTQHRALSTVSHPIPLGFVDLFVSRPTPDTPGVFPVHLEDGKVTPRVYELVFDPRPVTWVYLVVPSSSKRRRRLEILSEKHRNITFSGPRETRLANGRFAYELVSDQPLPLFDHSPFRFELREQAIPVPQRLIPCLPVPTPAAVQPDSSLGTAVAKVLVEI